jgi:hypothetical protein
MKHKMFETGSNRQGGERYFCWSPADPLLNLAELSTRQNYIIIDFHQLVMSPPRFTDPEGGPGLDLVRNPNRDG